MPRVCQLTIVLMHEFGHSAIIFKLAYFVICIVLNLNQKICVPYFLVYAVFYWLLGNFFPRKYSPSLSNNASGS